MPTLKPYVDVRAPWRRIAKPLLFIMLGFGSLVYGFLFAATVPYLTAVLVAPLALVGGMVIWALPAQTSPPLKTMELLFAAMLIGLVLWPNYLAFSLPGLPWITVIRLAGIPMAVLLLVAISVSESFRAEVRDTASAIPQTWKALVVLMVISIITIPFAKPINMAIQKAILIEINWTSVFVVSCYIFRRRGSPQLYIDMLIAVAIPIFCLSLIEAFQEQVVWQGHVPSFLKVSDDVADLILQSSVRTANGLYRAKATFSTPLGLAEFAALVTPFLIHHAVEGRSASRRVGAVVLIAVSFLVIRETDARLGLIGFIASFLLYFLLWGAARLGRNRRDLVGAAAVYTYPAAFLVSAALVVMNRRLHHLVLGDGAQAASDDARREQLLMGIPKILANPLGHGPAMSGLAMGYSRGDFITVDNYYLTLGLEYGVFGIAAFLLMYVSAIYYGSRYAISAPVESDEELKLVAPLTVSLSVFLIIKSVFSQEDNHSIPFILLGMITALVCRARKAEQAASSGIGKVETSSEAVRPLGAVWRRARAVR